MLRIVTLTVFIILLTEIIVICNPVLHKRVVITDSKIDFVIKNDEQQAKVVKIQDIRHVEPEKKSDTSVQKALPSPKSAQISQNTAKNTADRDTYMKNLQLRSQQQLAKQEEQAKAEMSARQKAQQQQPKTQPQAKSAAQNNVKPAALKQEQVTKTQKTDANTQPKTASQTPEPACRGVQCRRQSRSVQSAAVENQIIQAAPQKVLTEYEETVVWNKWRADVCNSVTQNVNSGFASIVPEGTTFSYSFDVDKNKQISNILVKVAQGYINEKTNSGASMIKTAIQSLNGKNILTFPQGTQRTSVNVAGAIKRSKTTKNINANEFNDTEVIKKQRYE